jgi:hypothetical protein
MAKGSRRSKGPKSQQRQRRERRFEPRASTNPWVVYIAGALGAVGMGAGAWGQFGPWLNDTGAEPFKYAPWILAAGAVLVGIAIWFGTSGEPIICVGDGGIGIERGTTRRIPWHQLEKLSFSGGAVRAFGKDDTDQPVTISASVRSHEQAAAWMFLEAKKRVPSAVDIEDESVIPKPLTLPDFPMDPLRVVGRHCARSGKVISYEPDGRVCARCERIYHREFVPAECLCGAPMTGAARKAAAAAAAEESADVNGATSDGDDEAKKEAKADDKPAEDKAVDKPTDDKAADKPTDDKAAEKPAASAEKPAEEKAAEKQGA